MSKAPIAIDPLDMSPPGEWPYSTHDEVSHLAILDVAVLRARIDMLLEERRNRKTELRLGLTRPKSVWRLTRTEGRFVQRLLDAEGFVTKSQLHVALSDGDEPDTDQKIVDVIACKVRKKLRAHLPEGVDPLVTHWGQGYEASDALRAAVAAS
jgi:DNA-binding response OmpR family regulator